MARHFFGNPRALLVGAQTALGTANPLSGDHHLIACEYDLPEPEYAQTEWKGGIRQAGAHNAPVPSRRGAKFKIKFPLKVGKTSWTVTDSPASAGFADPGALLIGTAWGSKGAAASAADWKSQTHLARVLPVASAVVAGTSASSIVFDGLAPAVKTDSGMVAGDFIACAVDGDDVTPQVGWVKTLTGSEPADVTAALYEAAANAANVGDRLLGAVTAFVSNAGQNPVTFKGFSGVTNGDFLLIGCVCVGGEIVLGGGDVWWCTLEYKCADYQVVAGSSTMPDVTGTWRNMRAATSANGGRLTVGPSGTGSAANVAGYRGLKLTWSTPVEWVESLAGIQGYGEPAVSTPEIKLAGEVGWDSSDTVTDAEHALVTAWRNGTAFSLCATSACRGGQIASLFLPSLLFTKASTPKASGEGGMVYMEFEATTGEYSSDGGGLTASAPANSLCRLGLA